MRILFVNDAARVSGAEKSLALLVSNLDPRHYQTVVVCPPGPYADYLRARGIEVCESGLQYYKKGKSLVQYVRSLFRAAQLARRFKADIVHCNSYRAAHWGIPLARLLGHRVVCHIRDCRYTRFSSLLMRNAGHGIRFIAVSEAVRQALIKIGVSHGLIDVIYNGADLEAFHPGVSSTLDAVGTGRLRLGVFGRIEERKRLIDAVQALSLLPFGLHPHLYIVGDAWTESGARVKAELESRIRELRVEQAVTFTGYVDGVAGIMAGMDIVLMPAVDEPFARVILEAMSLGKPIIGVRSGGTPEMIEHEVSGILAPPCQPAALAEAIQRLVNDPGLAQCLGQKARLRVQEVFTVASHVKSVKQLYRELSEQGHNGRSGLG